MTVDDKALQAAIPVGSNIADAHLVRAIIEVYEAAKGGGEVAATGKHTLQVAIKPLQWRGSSSDSPVGEYIARKDFLAGDDAPWDLSLDGMGIGGVYDSVREAKAAAQADYDARIRSALAPAAPPAVDLEKVEEALEPFDDALGEDDEGYGDGLTVVLKWGAVTDYSVTLGDLRELRRVASDIRKARE